MKIKSLPEHERPKEKMLYGGANALSTAELLALIIRTGSGNKSAVQLAEDVLAYSQQEIGSLGRAEVWELLEIEGIGTTKACAIVAGMELAKRLSAAFNFQSRIQVKEMSKAAAMLMEELRFEKREHVIELILNAKCEVESKVTISIGELTSATLNPREVFSPALRRGAAGIIIAHNHPSGDPEPSRDDIIATQRLIESSHILGIKVLDHIIIGDGKYISLRAQGYMQTA